MSEQFLNYKELSERWSIPIQTLRIWVMCKKLRPIKLSRHVRFKKSYIEKLEQEGIK